LHNYFTTKENSNTIGKLKTLSRNRWQSRKGSRQRARRHLCRMSTGGKETLTESGILRM